MADILKMAELLQDAGVANHLHPEEKTIQKWDEYRRKIATYLAEHGCNLGHVETLRYVSNIEKDELAVTDKLLEEQYRLMDEIPECPVHGNRCIPHAIEWVSRVKTLGRIIAQEE